MRWLIDETPGSPAQNMADDAALLSEQSQNTMAQPTVRVYQWDGPAVSIGRLQPEEPVRRLYPDLPIVRRPTGGRAVLHGEDLTLSVAVQLTHLPPDCRGIMASYHLMMGSVKAALEATGLNVGYGGCSIGSQSAVINCFDLSAACDLVDSNSQMKLVGSAQRREGAALLQQMSLPCRLIPDYAAFLQHLQDEFEKTFAGFNAHRLGT